jgi:protein-S-isoprenylcysteine O-methyltransferase Ste14
MASVTVKTKITSTLGWSQKNYRFVYNLFNIIALILLIFLLFQTPSSLLFKGNTVLAIIGLLVLLLGVFIIFLAVKNYDLPAFFGFRNETSMALQVKGIHKYARHPLYSGTLLLFLGICIALPETKNLILFLLMFIYILVGIKLEEKKLVATFGNEYRSYQEKVKQLIPYIL